MFPIGFVTFDVKTIVTLSDSALSFPRSGSLLVDKQALRLLLVFHDRLEKLRFGALALTPDDVIACN